MTLTKFVRAGAATVGALAMATQVNAADLYSGGGMKDAPVFVPAAVWTGFYFGANIGAGWANLQTNSHSLVADSPWLDTYFPGIYNPGYSVFGGDTLQTTGLSAAASSVITGRRPIGCLVSKSISGAWPPMLTALTQRGQRPY